MKRKFLAMLLAAAMVIAPLAFGPVDVQASPISVANESQLRQAVAQAGTTPTTIALSADIELVSNFVIPGGANITLTSVGNVMFSLIATRDMPTIEIQSGGTLTIDNISVARQSGTRGRGVQIVSGTFIMNSGTISGQSPYGIEGAASTFTMNGGIINNNRGGVRIQTFTMNGGYISGNDGSGVTILTSGIMNGGTISGNAGSFGGGINVERGRFTMNGGTISGNASVSGGGVLVSDGTFIMNGGTISGNTAPRSNDSGGGVKVEGNRGTFTMNGGIISGNTAGRNGGGVSVPSGTFTMNRGIIRDNTAGDSGGGVHNDRTFNFYGGWIFNNNAPIGNDHQPGHGTFNNNVFDLSIGAIGAAPPAGAVLSIPVIVTGTPVTSNVLVNGQSVAFQAYNIDGNTFFRLRDIAYALNGTAAQFNVGWDGAANAIAIPFYSNL